MKNPSQLACIDNGRVTDAELIARGLPKLAFTTASSFGVTPAPVIAVRRGELGYYPILTRCTAEALNETAGVTQAQADAMVVGSMCGWDAPGAFPKTWEAHRARRAAAQACEATANAGSPRT